MIRMVCGKIGGGKTFYALRDIIEELVFGSRVVVTNIELKLPELNAYIQRTYPKADVDLFERVRIIDKDQTRYFWLHREPGNDLEYVGAENEKRGINQDFPEEKTSKPVLYVLDEVHVCFDARNWMNVGLGLTFYNSQHRKFDDEIVFITQFLELVDKRLKGFAQEYIHIRNNMVETVLGFRGPPWFTASVYLTPKPTGPAMSATRFRLDLAIAACYDTSAGVGIKGRAKPERKKPKGLPLYWAAALLVLLFVGIFSIPKVIHAGAAKISGSLNSGIAEGTQSVREGLSSTAQPARSETPSRAATVADSGVSYPSVYCTGYMIDGGKILVMLSDGTVWDQRDVDFIRRDQVGVRGRVYPVSGYFALPQPSRSEPNHPDI